MLSVIYYVPQMILTFDRITLAHDIRNLPKALKGDQADAINTRRQRLHESIDEFNTQAKLYLPASVFPRDSANSEWQDVLSANEPHDPQNDVDEFASGSDEDTDLQTTTTSLSSHVVEGASSIPPEQRQILLPSSFGARACKGILAPFSSIQLLLCKGLANDTIQALRLMIGKQSFHYRKKIRKGVVKSNYNIRTRSHKEAQENSKAIKLLARTYRKIHQTMITLGASEDDKAKYQVLSKEDIKSSTAVVDFNASGQRNKTLSWIWHTQKSTAEDPSWLKERTSIYVECMFVYHVE